MKIRYAALCIIVLVALAISAFVVLHLGMPPHENASPDLIASTPHQPTFAPPRTPPAAHTEFRSERYRFAIFYPNDLSIGIHDKGNNTMTIIYLDPKTAQGFQVFVSPDNDTQITDARFKHDEPSGIRQNLQNTTVAGVPAMQFYGEDARGSTAEVWFIHGGFLFEVSAKKSQASLLDQVMQTWQFI